MALKLYERYPQLWESPSNDYPQGAFKNLSAQGETDGSYLEKDWLNDYSGFFGALLKNAQMTPDGTVDTAQKSQFYDALIKVAKKAVSEEGYRKLDDLSYEDGRLLTNKEIINDWDQASDENVFSAGFVKDGLGYVTPEMFGALGDGITDDNTAMVSAIESARNSSVNLVLSKSYLVNRGISIPFELLLGNGKLNFKASDLSMSLNGSSDINFYVGNTRKGQGNTPDTCSTMHDVFVKMRSMSRFSNSRIIINVVEDIVSDGVRISEIPTFWKGIHIKSDVEKEWLMAQDSSNVFAIRDDITDSSKNYYRIENIKFKGWDNGANSGCVLLWEDKTLITRNCRFENNRIAIWVSRRSEYRSEGDYFDSNHGNIYCQYFSNAVIGIAEETTIMLNSRRDIFCGRLATVHVDHLDSKGSDRHLYATQSSRVQYNESPTVTEWINTPILVQSNAYVGINKGNFEEKISAGSPRLVVQESGGIVGTGGTDNSSLINDVNTMTSTTVIGTENTSIDKQWLRLNYPSRLLSAGAIIRFTASFQGDSEKSGYLTLGSRNGVNLVEIPIHSLNGYLNIEIITRDNNVAYVRGTFSSGTETRGIFRTIQGSTYRSFCSNLRSVESDIFVRTSSGSSDFLYIYHISEII